MSERHNEFIDVLHAEGNGEFEKRTAVTLNDELDTALFLLTTDDRDAPMLVGRTTNLATDGQHMLVQLQVFADAESPLISSEFAVPLNGARLQALKPLPFAEYLDDPAAEEILSDRKIYGAHPIYFAKLQEDRSVGEGELAFIPGDNMDEGGRIKHLSGIIVSYFRRQGRESDGEGLEGEDVTEVRVIHPDPDVETEHFVDLSENVDVEGRAGNRIVVTRKVASVAGAAAVVSAGAVAFAYKVGKSRFKR